MHCNTPHHLYSGCEGCRPALSDSAPSARSCNVLIHVSTSCGSSDTLVGQLLYTGGLEECHSYVQLRCVRGVLKESTPCLLARGARRGRMLWYQPIAEHVSCTRCECWLTALSVQAERGGPMYFITGWGQCGYIGESAATKT
jgi:hypothetical protein